MNRDFLHALCIFEASRKFSRANTLNLHNIFGPTCIATCLDDDVYPTWGFFHFFMTYSYNVCCVYLWILTENRHACVGFQAVSGDAR